VRFSREHPQDFDGKVTTFAATVLTLAGDVVRFLDFIFKKTSSI
jgi:hypothetical protein